MFMYLERDPHKYEKALKLESYVCDIDELTDLATIQKILILLYI